MRDRYSKSMAPSELVHRRCPQDRISVGPEQMSIGKLPVGRAVNIYGPTIEAV